MIWIHTPDGVTITETFSLRPRKHREAVPGGTMVHNLATDATANSFGYWPLDSVDPGPGWSRTSPRTGAVAGGVFVETWEFDQARADAIAAYEAAEADREAEAVALRGMVTALRGVRDDPRPAQNGQRLARLEQDVTILARALLRKLRIDQDD